jgi:hypothetical protein
MSESNLTSKKSYVMSVIAVKRRIKILEALGNKLLSTKQLIELTGEKGARIVEDMQRLKQSGYVFPVHKGYCPLSKKMCYFYKKTNKKYYGYDFIASVDEKLDLEAAAAKYKLERRMSKEYQVPSKDVYIKVEGNPHATIVMNSNRPAGFYAYQKPKANVNRGIGSTFSMFEGAMDGL